MIRINLLPAKVRQTKGTQRIYTYAILGSSMGVIILILLLLNLFSLIHRVNVRVAQIESTGAKLADQIAYLRLLTARERQVENSRLLVKYLLPGQAVWISILDELADLIREDLWLTQLRPARSAASAPLKLEMEGEAYSKISVADFLSALENSARFADVHLEALNDTQTANHLCVRFKLNVNYRPSENEGGNLP